MRSARSCRSGARSVCAMWLGQDARVAGAAIVYHYRRRRTNSGCSLDPYNALARWVNERTEKSVSQRSWQTVTTHRALARTAAASA